MPRYDITLSREAGIYTTTVTIHAESEEDAQKDALQQAKRLEQEKWEYNEDYFLYARPLIQVEQIEEVMA